MRIKIKPVMALFLGFFAGTLSLNLYASNTCKQGGAGNTQDLCNTLTVTVNNYTSYNLEFGLRNYGVSVDYGEPILGAADIAYVSGGNLSIPDNDSLPLAASPGADSPGTISLTMQTVFSGDSDSSMLDSSAENPYFYGGEDNTKHNSGSQNQATCSVMAFLNISAYCMLPVGATANNFAPSDLASAAPRLDFMIVGGGSMVTYTYESAYNSNGSSNNTNSNIVKFAGPTNVLTSPDGKDTLVVCATATGQDTSTILSTEYALAQVLSSQSASASADDNTSAYLDNDGLKTIELDVYDITQNAGAAKCHYIPDVNTPNPVGTGPAGYYTIT